MNGSTPTPVSARSVAPLEQIGIEQQLPPPLDDEIHGKLVNDTGQDVEGLLAYGIFKQSERDWIGRFHTAHGRAPTANEIHGQFYFSYDDGDIERLRTKAESMMVDFALSILDDERPAIEANARKAAHDAQIDRVLAEIRTSGSFWRSVIAGVIASLVFAVLTIALVATWFAPGLHDILKEMTH